SDGSLDLCARHFRRCHLRRRQIDVLHHTLRGSGNVGGKTEHRYCTDPDGRAYHRLTLHWRLHPRAAVAAMTNGPSSLSPSGYARDHLRDHVLATVAGMRARHLSRSIERITWFLAKCMLGRCIKGKPAMTLLRGARRLGLALAAAAAQLPADAAELN